MTRKETVALHLEEHGYITPGIAMLEYGMTNGLAQRILDLRADGWAIDTRSRPSAISGRTITRYVLADI